MAPQKRGRGEGIEVVIVDSPPGRSDIRACARRSGNCEESYGGAESVRGNASVCSEEEAFER